MYNTITLRSNVFIIMFLKIKFFSFVLKTAKIYLIIKNEICFNRLKRFVIILKRNNSFLN